jgi:hypothetical protein
MKIEIDQSEINVRKYRSKFVNFNPPAKAKRLLKTFEVLKWFELYTRVFAAILYLCPFSILYYCVGIWGVEIIVIVIVIGKLLKLKCG